LVLFGCEVLPKTLAVRRPEKWSLRVARPLLFLGKLSLPLRQTAQKLNRAILAATIPESIRSQSALTDEEYSELLELGYQEGSLEQSEKEIILQIISLD